MVGLVVFRRNELVTTKPKKPRLSQSRVSFVWQCCGSVVVVVDVVIVVVVHCSCGCCCSGGEREEKTNTLTINMSHHPPPPPTTHHPPPVPYRCCCKLSLASLKTAINKFIQPPSSSSRILSASSLGMCDINVLCISTIACFSLQPPPPPPHNSNQTTTTMDNC